MSHTISKPVEFRMPADDQSPLPRAVVRAGGKVLGRGKHKLYSSSENGFAFTLPGWRHPIILTESGELKYDDYNGQWGNPKDVETLKGLYGQEALRAEAASLGWMTMDEPNGDLTVLHPSGGQVRVTRSGETVTVDSTGFVGASCADATAPLLAALGNGRGIETRKAEYDIETARVRQIGEGQ